MICPNLVTKPLAERELYVLNYFDLRYQEIFKIQESRFKILKLHNLDKERKHGSSRPEVFLRKGVLKICSKFTGEHPCRSVISIKLLCNFIEITLRHGLSPVNLMHIFRPPFSKNTCWWLLLKTNVNCKAS